MEMMKKYINKYNELFKTKVEYTEEMLVLLDMGYDPEEIALGFVIAKRKNLKIIEGIACAVIALNFYKPVKGKEVLIVVQEYVHSELRRLI